MPIVEFLTPDGRHLLINSRREATSILVNNDLALNFDREGRLTGAWTQGRNYRRSLDNRVIEKQEGPQPGLSYRVRRELEREEGLRFLGDVHARIAGYRAILDDPRTTLAKETPPADILQVRDALDSVLACDPARLERDRDTFQRIYKPVSILPPDQYLALVLQVTEGCSYNRCAFCGFYRGRAFAVKTLDQLRDHIADVRAFFGSAINLRKSIFLADANALIIPQDRLVPIFDLVNAEFAVEPVGIDYAELSAWKHDHPIHFQGIYSFIDAFSTRRKTAQDLRELAARGLRRVYVGLESGDAELLKFLGKPNSPQDALRLVEQLKAGGVAVGLVILAGAGGEQYSEQHIRNTAQVISAMPLDRQDLIYFSELVDYPGSEYSALARDAGLRPLSVEEIEQQMSRMRAAFRFPNLQEPPKVSYYDVREFIY